MKEQTVYCVISHAYKKVWVYTRKIDAIYKHVEFQRGDRVAFKESTALAVAAFKGYEVVK